jgi:hypothetical protein
MKIPLHAKIIRPGVFAIRSNISVLAEKKINEETQGLGQRMKIPLHAKIIRPGVFAIRSNISALAEKRSMKKRRGWGQQPKITFHWLIIHSDRKKKENFPTGKFEGVLSFINIPMTNYLQKEKTYGAQAKIYTAIHRREEL